MDDLVPFASAEYFSWLGVLAFARGMDFLSTWVATPNMVLEGNPIAKKLGWRWGIMVNLALCLGFALWPLPAITISTTSLFVAARNFQSAWLMRSMGEESYRDWHVRRIQETRVMTYLLCLAGNTFLVGGVGLAVMWFSEMKLVLFGIGLGIVAYSIAVVVYTLLALWKIRRNLGSLPAGPRQDYPVSPYYPESP
jgi:hypothetical protein